jgi:hypothetical protein
MYISDGFGLVDYAVDKIREERKKAVREMAMSLKNSIRCIAMEDFTLKEIEGHIDFIAEKMLEAK